MFPPGAWAACAGDATIEDGAEIIIGIDAGQGASDSRIVWVDEHLNVGVKVVEGTGTAHEIDRTVDDLACKYRVREICADPWHVVGYLSEQWVPGTDQLHRAVTERRLTHPDDPALNRHVEGSMMRDTRRGLRIDKRPGHNNHSLVALLMAVARMEVKQPAGARLLGWI